MNRVLKDAPLACLMHNHHARESHGLTGQHRSHMVPDEVYDTAMARFGGSVILTDTAGGHYGIGPIHHIVIAVPMPPTQPHCLYLHSSKIAY